jgi:hypothetical protein
LVTFGFTFSSSTDLFSAQLLRHSPYYGSS